MSDRAAALRILREARELLLRRLAERVRESEEAVLDDARGESYLSEIDAIHEQIGLRLIHVNQLLANLPEEEPHAATESTAGEVPFSPGGTTREATASIEPDAPSNLDAQALAPAVPLASLLFGLPAPKPTSSATQSALAPAGMSWGTFVAQIRAGEQLAAARALVQLLGVPYGRAVVCAEAFRLRCEADPLAVLGLWTLHREARAGRLSAAALALEQCFELRGVEVLGVLEYLLQRGG